MKHIADRLEIAQGNNNAEELIPEAIAVLRQQQALINQLEETQDYLYKTHDADKAEIDFLKKEILAKHEDWKHEGQQAANARAEIGCYKIELELHKAMIQDLENTLKNAQTNPLQNKLDVIANRIVFGKAQE